MLEKTYHPEGIEKKHYQQWEESGAFCLKRDDSRPHYTMMMPPPNITGSLHIGHALNHTLQDILVRYMRMRGFNVLWQPGVDHAGISTQLVVERSLATENLTRQDLGRDRFIERVWQWKQKYGSIIVSQLKRLGISPDWSRERFTMDEGLNLAVRKVFADLYRQGLIYKDKRLVNWDPKLHTAISDLEVSNAETQGSMWYINYPLAGQKDGFMTIATTRPETLFGDTAVAVHPEDDRYKHLIGQKLTLPLVGREIPIIADTHCDPKKGTGAVKITPAHDFNDFEVGKRHQLLTINIFDRDARLNDQVPLEFQGLDRFEARRRVIIRLKDLGLLEKIEETILTLPYGQGSGEIIEPRLTDQWYVDAASLVKPAIKAVEQGETCFVPENWAATYFSWLNNIQPWCISRQLWWGHRIPIWYGPDQQAFAAHDLEEAHELALKHYGYLVELSQDENVLDTWFSSALWPFSTLGWPHKTEELAACYPTQVLITGHDIIFFWVARMMMMGLHFMGNVPFKTVYITALVRDEKGQKMSKTKGNVVDPLTFIEKYGADALRFSLAALAGPGRDVNFSEAQVQGYRNFATKLWNAFRYCEHNACVYRADFNPQACQHPINRWIVSEIYRVGYELAHHFEKFRFDELCSCLYQFIWGKFCDWYLEFTKSLLADEEEDIKRETRAAAAWALGQILHLLHPFMPFITEELWAHLLKEKGSLLIQSRWPDYATVDSPPQIDQKACEDIQWLIGLISDIRALRSQINVPVSAKIPLHEFDICESTRKRLKLYHLILIKMARIEAIHFNPSQDSHKDAIQFISNNDIFLLALQDIMDLEKERTRLKRALLELEKEIKFSESKLSNSNFIHKATPEVVERAQHRLREANVHKEKMIQALERLQKFD